MENNGLEKLEANKKYIIIGVIALIVVGLIFFISLKNRIEVRVVSGEIGNISKNIYSDASIKSDEEAKIHSQVNGEIKKINHRVGDLVNKGEVLYELDKEAIQDELDQLKVYLEKEEKNNEKMKNNITVEEVELKSSEVDMLEMELDDIKREEAHVKMEYESGQASLEEYQGILEEKIKKENEFNQAKRDFQAANRALIQNLNMETMGKLKELTLKKKRLEELLKNHTIKASVSGVVLDQIAEKGEYIKKDAYLMKIGKIENIYLDVRVPNEFSEVVEKDMEVAIVIDGPVKKDEKAEDEKGQDLTTEKMDLTGIVGDLRIDKLKLDLGEDGAVMIKVYNRELIDTIEKGMKFKVGIEVANKEGVLLLPENVFIDDDHIFVVENKKVVKRKIEKGIEDGRGLIEVKSGLSKDDRVIKLGSPDIKEGARVKVLN